MKDKFLTKTTDLEQSDLLKEILAENYIHFTTKKEAWDDEKVVDFNRVAKTIHNTEFYVDEENLSIAKDLILQLDRSKAKSLYLKSYSFRSILFALLWLFGITSVVALYLGIRGFLTENKFVASIGIILSCIGLWYSIQHYIWPLFT
ncbi:MAG: hypothetical protein PF447_10990 [Spirochaetaceae bacterium]|jgi:hypothetical protein|nr:hypothetical protein [Spirochaetaceae bacterium]